MKIKNKLKKIVLVCSLFILVFCFSVPVFAGFETMPTVPIKPAEPVVTDNFLISFGNFIRGFFNSMLDFKVALVCFCCIICIGVIGLVFSIAKKRF